MVLDVPLLELLHLFVGRSLNRHEVIVGLWQGADQLVEFELRGHLLPSLRVMQEEQHYSATDHAAVENNDSQKSGKPVAARAVARTHDHHRDNPHRRRVGDDAIEAIEAPAQLRARGTSSPWGAATRGAACPISR